VSTIVKPLLTASFAGLRSLSSEVISRFGDRFSDYVAIQAERHSRLSTIVFGHQKSLADLYIPLTLIPVRTVDQISESDGILIDRFQTKLLPSETRILITDTAGMGKSTLSKFLFLQCLKSCYAVPIFIELRHLSSDNNIASILQRQLNLAPIIEDEPKFTKRQIERIFKKGGLVVFFDGYDEIPFKDREAVTNDIKEFIETYPENSYIITSRPETGLLAFPAFKHFSIKPLTRDESYALIRKYDQGSGRAEQLISKLSGRDFKAVQEFLKNPLLTSLLYRCFEYKQSVPIKKHIFYRQVFDALFDWHDSSKDGYNTREKKSGLDVDAFHRVLRVIGFVSVMKGEVEGDTDAVLAWIRKAREVCATSAFSESDFLDDLVRAVPVFVKDGDLYRWSHKSLAEYFAAQYICAEGKGQQEQILGAFISSGRTTRFSNVLDQIYDIDVVGFRTHLTMPLAKAFSTYWNSSYKGLNPGISAESIRLRKEVFFDKTLMVVPFEHESLQNPSVLLDSWLALFPAIAGRTPLPEFSLRLIETGSGPTRALAIVTGAFSAILDILRSKSDPLVKRREAITLPSLKSPPNLSRRIEPHLIDDSSNSDYNQIETFEKTTRLALGSGYSLSMVVVDSDRMLTFENGFRDAARLSELADELIQPMPGK
jgi:hypothetical protein